MLFYYADPLTHAKRQKLVQTGHGKKRNRAELGIYTYLQPFMFVYVCALCINLYADSLPHARRQEMQVLTTG